MTARERPAAGRQVRLVADERDLIERAYLDLMASTSRSGHRYMVNNRESRGECSHRRCAKSCRDRLALLHDMADYLERMNAAPTTPGAAEGERRAG